MKKKTKNLLLLVIVLVLLAAGYVALPFMLKESEKEEEAPAEVIAVTDFSEEDIAYYYYDNGDYEIGFFVSEDTYRHYQEEDFDVNTSTVEEQLAAIGDLTALQVVAGTEKSEYGLDQPKITVAVTLTDGTNRTFFLGDNALFEDAVYLLDVEQNIIYLVEDEFAQQFSCSWSDLQIISEDS